MPSKKEIVVTISKEELAQLPIASFDGNIVVVDSEEQVDAAIDALESSDIIGFDTETRPSFRKGQSYLASLIQLSTDKECFLFRINHIGFHKKIIDILENPGIMKIGLSIHDDFHNLKKIMDFEPTGFVDLQSFVKKFKIADNSLARIYAILFNKRISKGQRLTNWEAAQLTPNQQQYAALDAHACVEIFDYLNTTDYNPETSPYCHIVEPEAEDNQ